MNDNNSALTKNGLELLNLKVRRGLRVLIFLHFDSVFFFWCVSLKPLCLVTPLMYMFRNERSGPVTYEHKTIKPASFKIFALTFKRTWIMNIMYHNIDRTISGV